MNVYSYYHKVPGHDEGKESELIALWKASWQRNGWTSVLLSHPHAAAHPLYREFDQIVRKLPTINNREYERACWLRWLAFARMGGGMMTDYDVINRNFTPDQIKQDPVYVYDRGLVPCAVSAKAAETIVRGIFHSRHPDKGHYSDMYWFQAQAFPHDSKIGAAYKDHLWEAARMVHFSHHACGVHCPDEKRADIIRREMSL